MVPVMKKSGKYLTNTDTVSCMVIILQTGKPTGLPVGGTVVLLSVNVYFAFSSNFMFLCPADALIRVPSSFLISIRPVERLPKMKPSWSLYDTLSICP